MAGLNYLSLWGPDVWGKFEIGVLPILNTSTFGTGDVLQWVTGSGYLQLAATSTNVIANGVLVAGIAMEPALDPVTGVVKKSVAFAIARSGIQWTIPLYSATVGSTNPVSTLLSNQYNLYNAGSNQWYCDYDSTTYGFVTVVDIAQEDYPGWPNVTSAASPAVAYPAVVVEWRSARCAFDGAR